MRPESDVAFAFSVAGRTMRPVGPRKLTFGVSETAAEESEVAAATHAKAIAAHRFPRSPATLRRGGRTADAMMYSTGSKYHLLGRSLTSQAMADRK
jgi:hypothetical protein